jgi:hypothetical protein
MSYYSGILEHDTGIHADAEQAVVGQQMLMMSITVAEYRSLVEKNSKSDYILQAKDAEIKSYKQKLYDALMAIDKHIPMTEAQKEDFRKLCGDWQVNK